MKKQMIKAYLFDWGDTLMVDFPGMSGKMCNWDIVEATYGAQETLAYLSQRALLYIATGASESTVKDIQTAFSRVGLDYYITEYFCKANTGLTKGTPEFLEFILSSLKFSRDNIAMVGDSFEKDIFPAASIGIRSFWLSKSAKSRLPANCVQISTLLELCR